jgi:hypothetical protein
MAKPILARFGICIGIVLAAARADAQVKPLMTPWGEPDLRGTWP